MFIVLRMIIWKSFSAEDIMKGDFVKDSGYLRDQVSAAAYQRIFVVHLLQSHTSETMSR